MVASWAPTLCWAPRVSWPLSILRLGVGNRLVRLNTLSITNVDDRGGALARKWRMGKFAWGRGAGSRKRNPSSRARRGERAIQHREQQVLSRARVNEPGKGECERLPCSTALCVCTVWRKGVVGDEAGEIVGSQIREGGGERQAVGELELCFGGSAEPMKFYFCFRFPFYYGKCHIETKHRI